ncbi:MAG: hypothetical protein RL318_902 [Fibrobacterota bacterium]|jgi:TM2 domain-containing membrane protein YozV
MVSWTRISAIGLLAASLTLAQPVARDSTSIADTASAGDTARLVLPQSFPSDANIPKTGISPALAAGASLVLPGLGQILARHPVKGGVTMALDLGLYSSLWQIQNTQLPKLRGRVGVSDPIEATWRRTWASLDHKDTTLPAIALRDSVRLRRNAAADSAYKNREKIQTNLDLRNPELVWAIGVHAWSVVDAFDEAWHQRHPIQSGRSGLTAGLLSALVPGAGQIYNERYGKSAMLWMALSGSWVSQAEHQKTLDFYHAELALARADGRATTQISTQIDQFRKHRNQYYWGMGLLYVYQIIDAVVDARLDETRRPFRIGLDVGPGRLGLASALTF